MKANERNEKGLSSPKEKKDRKSKSFNGEPKETSKVERTHHLDEDEDTTVGISFLIHFWLAEGELRGKITHRRTRIQTKFLGLDQTTITQFMKKYLSRLEKRIIKEPVEEPSQQIQEVAVEQEEEVKQTPPSEMRTRSFAVIPAGTTHPGRVLQVGQPFQIQWSFEPPLSFSMESEQLDYKVIIYRKELPGGSFELVGEIEGQIDCSDRLTASIQSEPLPPGTYRLEGNSLFSIKSKKPEWRSLCHDSYLIQVI